MPIAKGYSLPIHFIYSSAIVLSRTGMFSRGLTPTIFWRDTPTFFGTAQLFLGYRYERLLLLLLLLSLYLLLYSPLSCDSSLLLTWDSTTYRRWTFISIADRSTIYSKCPPSFKYFGATGMFLARTRMYNGQTEPPNFRKNQVLLYPSLSKSRANWFLMCRGTPLLNFDLDVLTVDLDMLDTYQGFYCGGFKPWRLVLVMVTTNKKQYERLRRFFSLKDFLLFW